jgi:flagellin-specific chaperone FliS
MHKDSPQKRVDALAQLKAAQKMISEGQQELARAHQKIKRAQSLIDQSAVVLRQTWTHRRI